MDGRTERPVWRRSSACTSATCVEVARVGGRYLIRDGKNPDAGTLSFTEDEWGAFVRAVKRDEFRFQ